jgi:ATP-binding cassette, subfamily C (CFTR/MRP), member 1
MVGTIIITGACLCAVWEHVTIGPDDRFAGLAGLSITYALSVTQSLNWTVRMSSDLEAAMVAVERVKEYCGIENEAARTTEADSALTTWPSSGSIDFQDVKLRYRPGLPLGMYALN